MRNKTKYNNEKGAIQLLFLYPKSTNQKPNCVWLELNLSNESKTLISNRPQTTNLPSQRTNR